MTSEKIEAIIERVEAAQSIGTKDIDRLESGKHPTVFSYDFGIVSTDNNGACWMYKEDYEFILHAPNDIRDLVKALEIAGGDIGGLLQAVHELEKKIEELQSKNERLLTENAILPSF